MSKEKTRDTIEKAALRATQKSLAKSSKRRRHDPADFKLGSLLGDESLLDFEVESKELLLRSLSEVVALQTGYPSAEQIFRSAEERESTVNTYVGEGVAVPHARVSSFDGFAIAIARNPHGFPYGLDTPEPVQVVIFVVGNEADTSTHVQLLAAIASAIKSEEVRQGLLEAEDVSAVRRILNAGARGPRRRPRQLTKLLLSHSRKIARDIGATAVIVSIEHAEELTILKRLPRKESFVVATRSPRIADNAEKVVDRVIRLPDAPLPREVLVRVGTLMGVAQGFIERDDVVAFLCGEGDTGLDTFTVLSVPREFGRFLSASGELSPHIHPGVFERLLTLASELAREGREGKPIGTLFVVGDPEELAQYCEQLVINPFRGYPEEERSILDPTLRETIKEFAMIDGGFILRGDGVIVSAGTYLRPGEVPVDLPPGLGTRHRVGAAISAVADCVSVVVSASTGEVTFFKKGERIFVAANIGV